MGVHDGDCTSIATVDPIDVPQPVTPACRKPGDLLHAVAADRRAGCRCLRLHSTPPKTCVQNGTRATQGCQPDVKDLSKRALGFGSWALGLGPWALGLGPWALGLGPWALGVE